MVDYVVDVAGRVDGGRFVPSDPGEASLGNETTPYAYLG